jgi:hypothetical protein
VTWMLGAAMISGFASGSHQLAEMLVEPTAGSALKNLNGPETWFGFGSSDQLEL